jgi:lipopolysaccharide transport system permease protein
VNSIAANLKELFAYRELLWMLVLRDIRVRYKNTWLGFFWSLVNPVMQVAVMTVVLKYVLRIDIDNYSIYLFCAFLPWTFFQLSLLEASDSLLHNEGLMRKVYFPREVIPLAHVLSNLFHFVLATLVFFAILILLPLVWWPISHQLIWPLQWTAVLVPIAMAIEFLLVVGLAFWISATNLFYEDVRYLLTVALSVFYYAVPVLYFAEFLLTTPQIPAEARRTVYTVYMLNPLAAVITAFRKWVLPPTRSSVFVHAASARMTPTDYAFLGIALLTSLLVALAGYTYFNHRKWRFSERP